MDELNGGESEPGAVTLDPIVEDLVCEVADGD